MTIANPSTRPISGAPGLASPVVMSRAVAAAGGVMGADQFEQQDGEADPGDRRHDLAQRRRSVVLIDG